jgi:hypothetical protein
MLMMNPIGTVCWAMPKQDITLIKGYLLPGLFGLKGYGPLLPNILKIFYLKTIMEITLALAALAFSHSTRTRFTF